MYFYRKILKIHLLLSVFITTLIILSSTLVFASSSKYVILGGDAIGLKIDTGIYVAGKYNVNTNEGKLSPWIDSDINEGDKLLSCNGHDVDCISDLTNIIKNSSSEVAVLRIQRNEDTFNTTISVVETINGERTLGLYLKDKLIGIGTLTFIEPKTKSFASLGHGISDNSLTYGVINGDLVLSNVEGIKKGVSGISGQKKATISNIIIGNLKTNTISGVYGKVSETVDHNKIEIANQSEVKKGKAKIYTVLKDDKIEEFDIEIVGINLQESLGVKGLKIKVIDERLIKEAGGIVQGMSGSPIIQNNKLIGAISHVSLDDPTIGYGMHATWMYEECIKIK